MFLFFRDVFSQILPKTELNGIKIQDAGPDDLNVLVIFIESVSRLTWLRHASDVHNYLTQELGVYKIEPCPQGHVT